MILSLRTPLRLGARHIHPPPSRRLPLQGQRCGQRHSSTSNSSRKESSGANGSRSSNGASDGSKAGETPLPGTQPEPVDIPIPLWYHRLGPVSDFFVWFHRQQVKTPYRVQLGTTLTTYLCGDLLAQEIGGEEYDGVRTLRMLSIGAIAAIPGYKWFLFLGAHFNYASKALSIFTKVVVNQIVFAPVFNTYFFGMQAFLTGEPPSGVINRITAAVPTSLLNSVKLWPAVTAFSFWVVPAEYRFMFSGVFAVAWQAYLSFLNRKEEIVVEETDAFGHPAVRKDD